MRKFLLIAAFCLVLVPAVFAQKKVAVVTFYVNKQIDVTELGGAAYAASVKLSDDPRFNLTPLLKNFHQQFFDTYSKSFPFQLLPEDQVTGSDVYKNFTPANGEGSGVLKISNYLTPYDGYKTIIPLAGHSSEKQLAKLIEQCDGVMVVYIDFKLVKIGFGGMGVVKVVAKANMALYNKAGDKVFAVSEEGKSKSQSPMVGGVPVMSPEKVMPMCESALAQLMEELPGDLPKITKKTDAKL